MKDYYFIMNAGVKAGGEITHAVLEGKIVSAPKGYDAFTGIEAAREKLACGNIRQQMFIGLKTENRGTRYFPVWTGRRCFPA